MVELAEALRRLGDVAVAVSGGVDSMTLAVVAHRDPAVRAAIFHAVSPAVPPEATERVRRYAQSEGWNLRIIDAQEFRDADYVRNPVTRCFHCKSNLYGTIAAVTDAKIVSGTNIDDLGDFRPGLTAARALDVRHPYVDAGIDKDGVRRLAGALGLGDLADLPSAPCLSSRIETGLAIDPTVLRIVHEVERELTDAIAPKALVFVHPDDAAELGLADGDLARVSSRRGAIELEVSVSHREARGNCFIPFHFREAAANLLTIDEIDPFGKIPEFKFCAVRIEAAHAEAGHA